MSNRHTRLKKNRFAQIKEDGPEIVLNVMSNNPTETHYQKLQMFYKGAFDSTIAYMEAKDRKTGELVELLVGFELNENGKFDIYPLAKVLTKEEITNYSAPDGRGNYTGNL